MTTFANELVKEIESLPEGEVHSYALVEAVRRAAKAADGTADVPAGAEKPKVANDIDGLLDSLCFNNHDPAMRRFAERCVRAGMARSEKELATCSETIILMGRQRADIGRRLRAAELARNCAQQDYEGHRTRAEKAEIDLADAQKINEVNQGELSALRQELETTRRERDESYKKVKTVADAMTPYLQELCSKDKSGIFATDAVALLVDDRNAALARVRELEKRISITAPTRSNIRNNMLEWTPAEKAIYDAVQAVENMTGHPLLTDAVILLGHARDKVAEFVESTKPPAVPEGVRVFEDNVLYRLFIGEECWCLWRHEHDRWSADRNWGDAKVYHKNYPDDRELSLAEIAELLAKHPMTPEMIAAVEAAKAQAEDVKNGGGR